MSNPKFHLLVIRLSAMGDVAMTVPVLRALSKQYPELKITLLTRNFFEPFFRDLPNITVFSADIKGKHKGVLGLYKLSKQLKNLKIDAIADLHNVMRSNILKYFFSGIPFVQLDKGRAEKKDLISGKIFKKLKTTHQRYADVFEALGYKLDLKNPEFSKPRDLSDSILKIVKKESRKLIGIAPFAAHESKMYPLNLMEQVIENLSKNHKIILFGGGDKEIAILSAFETKYEHVCNVAGKTTLNEELDLISNIEVMLSMDSGNAHIAAMLGIKTITIWGVTHPFAGFTPFNQPEDYALLPDRNQFPKIPTSVYGNKYPEDYKTAAGSISPETVVDKIKSILK